MEEAIEEERSKVEAKTPVTVEVGGLPRSWSREPGSCCRCCAATEMLCCGGHVAAPLHAGGRGCCCRRVCGSPTVGPPSLLQTFDAWVKEKEAKKRAAADAAEAERRKGGRLTGREIFLEEGFVAQDDLGASGGWGACGVCVCVKGGQADVVWGRGGHSPVNSLPLPQAAVEVIVC